MATSPRAPLSPTPAAPRDEAVVVVRVADGVQTDRFIKFQWDVYRQANDLHWVPPLLMERRDFLDPRKNPFYQHAEVALFLACRGDEVVGRIAAAEDRSFNAYHGSRTAYFGLYESVNDTGVAALLFGAVKDWARWRGLDRLIGPVNLTPNEVGLLVEGFDSEPYLMMPYNPRYYGRLFDACGLRPAKDLLAWERSARTPPPERFVRIANKVRQQPGLSVRGMDLGDFAAEVARIKQVYDAAWEDSWGPVPMTDAEFRQLAAELRPALVPELAVVVEDRGEPVAFSLVMPDLNQVLKRLGGRLTTYGLPLGLARLRWWARRIDRVRLVAAGIKPGWRRRGIEAVLVVETIRRARERGYVGGEISWTAEDNALARRFIEAAGCTLSKKYRLYELPAG